MESNAKSVVQCDNCKQRMLPEENIDDCHLQAKFNDSQNKPKDFHFCDEECLRCWLNKRAKRAKSTASTMQFFKANRTWEIDLKAKV